jgi:hypothetical protein
MSRECSVTSLRMPDIFEGHHVKMSALARRKSTSTTSYFGSRVELTRNTLPSRAVASRGTSLVCSAALKLLACLVGGVEALVGHFLHIRNCDTPGF